MYKLLTHFPYTLTAAAKSLQSCLTLCNPIDGSPQGSPIPGIVQARTPGWVAISFYSLLFCKISEKLACNAAAAAAKSLQSCPTLCNPIDGSPQGSPIPGILQARTLEWLAISFSNAWKWKVKVKSLSRVRLFATPWTAAYQAPLSMGFSRQEYWSGLPLPSPLMRRFTNKSFKEPSSTSPSKLSVTKLVLSR